VNKVKPFIVEKHAFVLITTLNKCTHYVLGKHVVVKVSFPIIKNLLSQTYLQGKLVNWVAKIQEFDMEIMIIEMVCCRNLTLFSVESLNILEDEDSFVVFELECFDIDIDIVLDPWYKDIIYYL
jgi:hypothetical protein